MATAKYKDIETIITIIFFNLLYFFTDAILLIMNAVTTDINAAIANNR